MQKIFVFFFFFFLWNICFAEENAHSKKSQGPKKNILYLNSYNNGYAWSDSIFSGVRRCLQESGENIYLQIEYMDSKRYYGKEIHDVLFNYYKFKFSKTKFDLIISSDNHAYNFLIEHADALFPGVPIVFCGVNDVQIEDIPMRTRMTGVLETFDVSGIIKTAIRLHPGKRRLIVIGDKSLTGTAIANQVRKGLREITPGIEAQFLDTFTLDDLVNIVRTASKDSIFFFIPFYKDVGQEVFSAQDLLRIVWEKTHVPLYTGWEFLLGYGAVGGSLVSGPAHGREAALMGLRILHGESPAAIPIQKSSRQKPVFDYAVLSRLSIPQAALPSGRRLINAPSSLYSINRVQLWTIIISLIVLSLVLILLVFNILERKQIEIRIKNQLSFLRTLMDTLPLPMYFTDSQGSMLGTNRAFENWFGLSRVEIQEGATASGTDARFACLLEERRESSEVHIAHQDGSTRSAVLHKALYADAQGKDAGIVGIIYDISDRKKAENDLRAAEEKYRSLFENSALGIFRTAPDGTWLDANPALAKMLGYENPQVMLQESPSIVSVYYYQEDRFQVLDLYRQRGGSIEFEVRFKTRDGEAITVNLNARAVGEADGHLCFYEGFIEDITDKKSAERALAASEAMLQLVLDSIPQLVHWKDKDLHIIGANRNFLRYAGHNELSAIVGKAYEDVVADQRGADTITFLDKEVMRTNAPCFRVRVETNNAAGEPVWLMVNKVPMLNTRGDIVGILSTAEDITQTINLEKQLLQSQKMEAIGTLAGGIAHDFNNILTSIMNSTELAMEDVQADTLVWKDMRRCLKAASRGSALIKQILTFSRPSQEGFLPTDLRDVVLEAVALLRASMPRNIRVESDLEHTLPLCLADPTQMHQIVMNLATNAFQALGESGGAIRICLGSLLLHKDDPLLGNLEPGEHIVITIEDNGPGIPEVLQDKIYDPFFTTKGKGEGTGLGLAVVHGIVRNHQGEIRLVSHPGATRFSIVLPTLADICLLPGTADGCPVCGTERLVFIEDDEDQLQIIPRVLSQLGYTVFPFACGADALRALCEDGLAVDAVITDFDMPGMNGLEVAQCLEECAPGMPVILISGRKQFEEVVGSSKNVQVFLGKPYTRDMLGKKIRKVLEGTAE